MSQKKRKLYLITQYYPYGVGEKTFIEPELKVITDSGLFDVTIISNAPQKDEIKNVQDSKWKCEWIPSVSVFKRPVLSVWYGIRYFVSGETKRERQEVFASLHCSGKLLDSVLFFIRAKLFYHDLKNKKLDFEEALVYTYWCNVHTLAIALNKGELGNIKLISRIHNFDLYDERVAHGRQPFRKVIDENLDKLFFIAKAGMDYYVDKMGTSSKYVLSYLGTKSSDICFMNLKKQKEKNTFLLVSCSNIIPLKRVELIIQALSKITDISVKWIHFGDGVERKNIENLAKEYLGKRKNVSYKFMGQKNNDEIMNFYKTNYVDCFITTSQKEGCPVSIQEAMSYGIPIIGTAVGEIPLMIDGNGILLDEDPMIDKIVEGIRCMCLETNENIYLMRSRSRKLWEKNFDGEKNYRKFLNQLIEIQE